MHDEIESFHAKSKTTTTDEQFSRERDFNQNEGRLNGPGFA